MQPIISPMFIYILGVIDSLESIFCLILIIDIIVFIFSPILADKMSDSYSDEAPMLRRIIKLCAIVFTFIILAVTFVPSKETLIAMYTTKYVTVENVKLGKEVVIDIVKEIVDVINK